MNSQKDSTPTDAMIIGSYTHSLILEPDKMSDYVIAPEGMNFSKKEGIQFKADNSDKQIIKYADHLTAKIMRDIVWNNSMCKTILSGGVAESSIFWKDEDSGVDCRIRPDIINHDLQLIIDLKTTIDASPEVFTKQSWNMDYHLQASFYQKGVYSESGMWYDWLFIAVEKDNPFLQPVLYKPDTTLLKYADGVICEQLPKFAECQRLDRWDGYPESIQTLTIPAWVKL
jgi:hypothetical protein